MNQGIRRRSPSMISWFQSILTYHIFSKIDFKSARILRRSGASAIRQSVCWQRYSFLPPAFTDTVTSCYWILRLDTHSSELLQYVLVFLSAEVRIHSLLRPLIYSVYSFEFMFEMLSFRFLLWGCLHAHLCETSRWRQAPHLTVRNILVPGSTVQSPTAESWVQNKISI